MLLEQKDVTLKEIIKEAVHNYGKELYHNIIINDLDDYANLVVRTRTELLNMIMKDNNYSITNYLGKI